MTFEPPSCGIGRSEGSYRFQARVFMTFNDLGSAPRVPAQAAGGALPLGSPLPSGRPQRLCARAAPRALLGAVTAALATPPRGGELPAGSAEAGQSAGPRPRPQGRGAGTAAGRGRLHNSRGGFCACVTRGLPAAFAAAAI